MCMCMHAKMRRRFAPPRRLLRADGMGEKLARRGTIPTIAVQRGGALST